MIYNVYDNNASFMPCSGDRYRPTNGARQGSGSRAASVGPAPREKSYFDLGSDHGRLHPLLAALLFPLSAVADVSAMQHTTMGLCVRLLAWLHQLSPQSCYLHHLQQGLQKGFPTDHLPLLSRWTIASLSSTFERLTIM